MSNVPEVCDDPRIPQQVGAFLSIKEIGGKYEVHIEHFANSAVRIIRLKDNRLVVCKVSTGAVCPVGSWKEAVGIRNAAMERHNAIERLCFMR